MHLISGTFSFTLFETLTKDKETVGSASSDGQDWKVIQGELLKFEMIPKSGFRALTASKNSGPDILQLT